MPHQLERHEPFGEGAELLSEPLWYQGYPTPYYNKSHVAWRKKLRDFVEEHMMPIISEWDEAGGRGELEKAGAFYKQVSLAAGKAGVLPGVVGCPWPAKFTMAPGPENYDYFHEILTNLEISRTSGGGAWAVMGGLGIGLPPLLVFGPEELAARVAPPCLKGEAVICLCITEPTAGSDVAGVRTAAAEKDDHFVVNGTKKWITNGIYADYFTVLCRTGKGAAGLSMLLVEKEFEGIKTQKMPGMGVWPSGTTYIEFKNVKVPKANVIGQVGAGFKQTMFNFNHERWLLCAQTCRMMTTCVAESLIWARTRKTFGKNLVDHQVIQHKIAEMMRVSEASMAFLEQITYLMNGMSKDEQNAKLGGHIALLKVQSTKNLEFCAREAMQVLGGTGYSRGICTSVQFGEKVERIYREVRAMAIPGGSEEIMLNLAVGQLGFVPPKKKKSPKAALKEMEQQLGFLQKKIADAKAKM